jgi:large subunit ribosomal protein L17
MRHRIDFKKLSRNNKARRALLRNLVTSLFKEKKIKTTLAKAKELRRPAERLITFAKRKDLSAIRQVSKFITEKGIVKELFEVIAPKYIERNGGYTRIVKIGPRSGDAAQMAFVELLEFESYFLKKKETALEKKQKSKEKKKKEKEKEKEEPPESKTSIKEF